MCKGQSIKVMITRSDNSVPEQEDFTVYQLYSKFAVLDNGLYKVCAFIHDLKCGRPIRV